MLKIVRLGLGLFNIVLLLLSTAISLAWLNTTVGPSAWIAYVSKPINGPAKILRTRTVGSQTQLLSEGFDEVIALQWSSDEKWIAFIALNDSEEEDISKTCQTPTVYRMRADGSDLQQVVLFTEKHLPVCLASTQPETDKNNDHTQIHVEAFVWSADNKRLLIALSGDELTFFRINVDGTRLQVWETVRGQWKGVMDQEYITLEGNDKGDFDRLAAALRRNELHPDMTRPVPVETSFGPSYLSMNATSPNVPLLTDIVSLTQNGPVYWAVSHSTKGRIVAEIYRISFTSIKRGLIRFAHVVTGDTYQYFDLHASPDGRWLAIEAERWRDTDLFLYDTTKSGLHTPDDLKQLTHGPADTEQIKWSPAMQTPSLWKLWLYNVILLGFSIAVALIPRMPPAILGLPSPNPAVCPVPRRRCKLHHPVQFGDDVASSLSMTRRVTTRSSCGDG